MVVSALVLTLDAGIRGDTIPGLADRRITLGDPRGRCLPLVLETDDEHESEQLARRLRDLDGVTHLDVVMVDFRDDE